MSTVRAVLMPTPSDISAFQAAPAPRCEPASHPLDQLFAFRMQVTIAIPGWSTPPVPPVICSGRQARASLPSGRSLCQTGSPCGPAIVIYTMPIAKTDWVCRSNNRSFSVRSQVGIGSGAAQAAYAGRPQNRRARPEKSDNRLVWKSKGGIHHHSSAMDAIPSFIIFSLHRTGFGVRLETLCQIALVLRSKQMIHVRSARYRALGRARACELNHLTGSEH